MNGSRIGNRLERGLRAALAGFDGDVAIDAESRRWTSIAFTGERHLVRVELAGSRAARGADAVLAGLERIDLGGLDARLVAIEPLGVERGEGGERVTLRLRAVTLDLY